MLSRRRSSERASVAQPLIAQTSLTPSQKRLGAALRGASIIFSVQARLDSTTNVTISPTTNSTSLERPGISRPPDVSGDLTASDVTGVRRLFSRESRLRRSRTPAPGDPQLTYHLVVASHGKASDVIRLHHLVDHGPGARAAVHRTWPLADLRKIDGLGRPVKESLQFTLYFASSNRATAWRCNSPQERATFLWSLLQTCVSHLKRAPPVTNLRLLDLQKIAESPTDSERDEADDESSGKVRPEAKQNRLNSSLDELAAERNQQSDDIIRASANPSDSSNNRGVSANGSTSASTPATAKNSGSVHGRRQTDALFEDINENLLAEHGDRIRDDSSESLAGAHGKKMREMTSQKVKRTLSEPKASKLNVNRAGNPDPDSDAFLPKRADTIAPVQRTNDPKVRELNIDERAFLAAAKQMGANSSFEMDNFKGNHDSNREGNPKARIFQQRLKMGEASTAKVVAERKLLQEKKLFKLSLQEQIHLTSVLQLFKEKGHCNSLGDFNCWAEDRIGRLENENITDTVNVEKTSMSASEEQSTTTTLKRKIGVLKQKNSDHYSYDSLTKTMTDAEPWLGRCQLVLAPYAALIKDIHGGVSLLEVQRTNASRLSNVLAELLETLSFEQSEQSLVDGIGTYDASLNLTEFDGEDFQVATRVIASKVAALQRLSPLADMEAVRKVQSLLSQRQREASSILMPMLREHIDDIYNRERALMTEGRFEKVRRNRFRDSMSAERQEFLNGAQSLAIFGEEKFVALIEHFISLSSTRVLDSLHVSREKVSKGVTKGAIVVHPTKLLTNHLFYSIIVESTQACQLFASILGDAHGKRMIGLPELLNRLVDANAIIAMFAGGSSDALRACTYLCISHQLQHIMGQIRDGNWARIIDILVHGIEASELSEIDFTDCSRVGVQKLSRNLRFEDNERATCDSNDLHSSPSASHSEPLFEGKRAYVGENVFGGTEDISACMSNYVNVSEAISKNCDLLAAEHVSSSIAALSNATDMNSDRARAEFLLRVQETVDLCTTLTSPEYEFFTEDSVVTVAATTARSFCERLVTAAMRCTEISTHGCIERVSDIVKLQCYGYIATNLNGTERPSFLIQFAHLSSSIRRHVMAKWAEREVYGNLLASLRIESGRPSCETQQKFQTALSEIDIAQTVSQMKELLLTVLGTAAKGAVFETSCTTLISLVKEKLEDSLRRAKKQRLSAETRSRLVTVSKDLLYSLRLELGKPVKNRTGALQV